MDDTISRQEALDALMNSELGSWNNDDYERGARAQHLDDVAAIKSVPSVRKKRKPSAQPEPRWIPCESEPPNKYGNYLITTGEGEVDIGTYSPDRPGAWSACDAKGFHWVSDVVAWMPLPTAYERSEE